MSDSMSDKKEDESSQSLSFSKDTREEVSAINSHACCLEYVFFVDGRRFYPEMAATQSLKTVPAAGPVVGKRLPRRDR
jgi:hypothetical protein